MIQCLLCGRLTGLGLHTVIVLFNNGEISILVLEHIVSNDFIRNLVGSGIQTMIRTFMQCNILAVSSADLEINKWKIPIWCKSTDFHRLQTVRFLKVLKKPDL